MSMESDLVALLQDLCTRVYPDVAPNGAGKPYVTWQGIGGPSSSYEDNTAPPKRNTYLQINAWSETRAESLQLIRAIEADMRAAAAFTATPMGEPLSTFEAETGLYGSIQRFEVVSTR